MGDRPITRPYSHYFQDHILESSESSSLEDDSVTATESPPTPGSKESDSPSVANDYVLDLNEEGSTSTPTPKEVGVTVQRKERALPYRRGSSKKRSRNEIFLANVCEIIHKQQEAVYDRFFKMKSDREKKSRVRKREDKMKSNMIS